MVKIRPLARGLSTTTRGVLSTYIGLGVLLVGSYDFNFWGFYMNYIK